jgi:hypothetical protein
MLAAGRRSLRIISHRSRACECMVLSRVCCI